MIEGLQRPKRFPILEDWPFLFFILLKRIGHEEPSIQLSWRSCRSPIWPSLLAIVASRRLVGAAHLIVMRTAASFTSRPGLRPGPKGCAKWPGFFVSVTSILKRKVEIFWGKTLWIYKNMYMYMFMYVCMYMYMYTYV